MTRLAATARVAGTGLSGALSKRVSAIKSEEQTSKPVGVKVASSNGTKGFCSTCQLIPSVDRRSSPQTVVATRRFEETLMLLTQGYVSNWPPPSGLPALGSGGPNLLIS